jgi:hypothetical protein
MRALHKKDKYYTFFCSDAEEKICDAAIPLRKEVQPRGGGGEGGPPHCVSSKMKEALKYKKRSGYRR